MPAPVYMNTINRFSGDGVTTDWNINFTGGYLRRAHVKGIVTNADGTVVLRTLTISDPTSFIGPYQIRVLPAAAVGEVVVLFRDTPKDVPLVDFTDGSLINEKNLDLVTQQAVFVAAEMVDAQAAAGVGYSIQAQRPTYPNRIINGAMRVVNALEFIADTSTPSGYGGPEMYQHINTAGGSIKQTQGAVFWEGRAVPTVRQEVLTPVTDLSGGNRASGVLCPIEGLNCYDLAGKPLLVQFLFATSVAGIYPVTVNFAAADGSTRYITTTFTVSVINTVQQVVLPLPPSPAGFYPAADGMVRCAVAIGSANSGTLLPVSLNTWLSAPQRGVAGQAPWATTAGAVLHVAELFFGEGTEYRPFPYVPIQEDFERCARYFQRSYPSGSYAGDAVTTGAYLLVAVGMRVYPRIPLAVRMRTTPTVTFYSPDTGVAGKYRDISSSTDNAASAGGETSDTQIILTGADTVATNNFCRFHYTANARM